MARVNFRISRPHRFTDFSSHSLSGCAPAFILVVALSVSFSVFTTGPAFAATSDLTGLWIDHSKRGAVEIQLCSKIKSTRKVKDKTALCGHIFWMIQEHDKNGVPHRDKLNQKASKRKRPICGMGILGKVKRISKRVYDQGWIYDPDQGKYFDVEIRLKSTNILQVKGYLGTKLLSKTFLWKRAQKVLKKCSPEPLR